MSQTLAPPPHRDAGFTLPEMLIVIILSGVLIAALATAIGVAVRATPTSEDRIDDARSTRSLSTWLSHDTTSSPPFLPEQSVGGFNIATTDDGTNNICGGLGTNIVHLRWSETVHSTMTYVANYRFVVDGDSALVRRYTCYSQSSAPYVRLANLPVTPALDPLQPPVASTTTDTGGNVAVLSFTLAGKSGETILIETASRNPSDFFP
jgi:prepilin-type N-terminal cleavage/methylation domain-containing protein